MKDLNKIQKLKDLVGKNVSTWLEDAESRTQNKDWLKDSQKTAVTILRTLREKEWSQVKLAEEIGVTPQTVNKWLKGGENFTFETVHKIQKALGINIMHICAQNDLVVKNATQSIQTFITTNRVVWNAEGAVQKSASEQKVIPLNGGYISDRMYSEKFSTL